MKLRRFVAVAAAATLTAGVFAAPAAQAQAPDTTYGDVISSGNPQYWMEGLASLLVPSSVTIPIAILLSSASLSSE